MNKFWEWMKENKYCNEDSVIHTYDHGPMGTTYEKFTKQMLIGYMIEYLNTKTFAGDIEIHHTWGIDTIYSNLKIQIENSNTTQDKI